MTRDWTLGQQRLLPTAMSEEAKVKEEAAGDRITIKVQDQARPVSRSAARSRRCAHAAARRELTPRGAEREHGPVQGQAHHAVPKGARRAACTAHSMRRTALRPVAAGR